MILLKLEMYRTISLIIPLSLLCNMKITQAGGQFLAMYPRGQ